MGVGENGIISSRSHILTHPAGPEYLSGHARTFGKQGTPPGKNSGSYAVRRGRLVKINPKTNTLVREGVASISNPFDEFALEEAILTKEKYGGEVHVISMGPPQATEVLKNAIAVGADKAYLVSDRAFAGSDTLATAYTLSKALEWIGGIGGRGGRAR